MFSLFSVTITHLFARNFLGGSILNTVVYCHMTLNLECILLLTYWMWDMIVTPCRFVMENYI